MGAVNLTAPHPATNAEFSRALGRALRRPAVVPVPSFALALLYGEMAQIVTTGQRVIPQRLLELGYEFRHPEVEEALVDVLGAA
jgi:NAD dependent epimerase/dehydratase family enzyme